MNEMFTLAGLYQVKSPSYNNNNNNSQYFYGAKSTWQSNAQGAACAKDEINDNIYKSAIGKVQT